MGVGGGVGKLLHPDAIRISDVQKNDWNGSDQPTGVVTRVEDASMVGKGHRREAPEHPREEGRHEDRCSMERGGCVEMGGPTIAHNTLRDGRNRDPQHKCCGKD